MTFSLADCVLRRTRTDSREGVEGSRTALGRDGAGNAAGAPAVEPVESVEEKAERLDEVRRLVRIIAWDWVELVEAVRELRGALEPVDFQAALEAAGIVGAKEADRADGEGVAPRAPPDGAVTGVASRLDLLLESIGEPRPPSTEDEGTRETGIA